MKAEQSNLAKKKKNVMGEKSQTSQNFTDVQIGNRLSLFSPN